MVPVLKVAIVVVVADDHSLGGVERSREGRAQDHDEISRHVAGEPRWGGDDDRRVSADKDQTAADEQAAKSSPSGRRGRGACSDGAARAREPLMGITRPRPRSPSTSSAKRT